MENGQVKCIIMKNGFSVKLMDPGSLSATRFTK